MQIEKWILPVLVFQGLVVSARADIVGGEEVRDQDPIRNSTAALYEPNRDGRGGALCTASVIGKDIAVTAAHCITPGGPNPVLLFGRDIHSPTTVKRPVTATEVNPLWRSHAGKGMDEGDIALVKFPGGLPEGYQTVESSKSDASLKKGASVVLAGYGVSDGRAKTGAGVLRKTQVQIANPRTGKTEMILDQSHGHGACHGDSGGPAFVKEGGKMVLAGVTNRSYPARAPDDCGHQVVYTKVNSYRSWIKKGEKDLRSARASESDYSAKASRRNSPLLKKTAHRVVHATPKTKAFRHPAKSLGSHKRRSS